MLTDREIKHLWISLTSNCNFDCSYCYISNVNQNVPLDAALETVSMFIKARGTLKVLDFYGGEPLLRLNEMKRIIDSAVSAADKLGKRILVRVATNGSLISEEFLELARAHKIKISISLDGGRDAQNKNRRFKNGEPTFDVVASKCAEALSACGEKYSQALMTVSPELAPLMYENVLEAVSMGFKNFHINPVPTVSWTSGQKADLARSLSRIMMLLQRSVEKEDFLFFEPVSQCIRGMTCDFHENLRTPCPFYKRLALLTSGRLALLPDLCFEGTLENYSIGTLTDIVPPFHDCRHDPSQALCEACAMKHRGHDSGYELQPHTLRNIAAERTAKKIVFGSKTSRIFQRYIEEAAQRTFE